MQCTFYLFCILLVRCNFTVCILIISAARIEHIVWVYYFKVAVYFMLQCKKSCHYSRDGYQYQVQNQPWGQMCGCSQIDQLPLINTKDSLSAFKIQSPSNECAVRGRTVQWAHCSVLVALNAPNFSFFFITNSQI